MRTRNQFGWALARRLPITAVLMVALACAGAGERSAAQVPGVTTSTMQGNLDALSQENVHDRGNGSLYPASGTFKLKGEIEVVTRDAVWVRRSDGSLFEALLPSQGDLRSQALAHSYHVGDEVELEAEFIPPQFVTADGHFFQLRLRQLRFRGHGAGRSLAAALRSPAWRAADNLLPLPAGTPAAKPEPAPQPGDAVDAFLAATRQAERRSLAELPNFLVTETITRTAQVASSEVTDRIESELAVASGRERRSAIWVNGAAWNHPFAALSGLHWTSDFADRLLPIFQPSCGAVLTPAGHGQQGGQAVAIYSFRLPPGLCAGRVQAGPAWAYPGFEGKLYISMASHLVVRLEQRHTQLPGDFAETAGQDATDWAPATVAGEPWLMPARARMLVRFRGGRSVTLTASYTNYRRFESRSRVTVVGGAPK